jgi:hypothetical protein
MNENLQSAPSNRGSKPFTATRHGTLPDNLVSDIRHMMAGRERKRLEKSELLAIFSLPQYHLRGKDTKVISAAGPLRDLYY